MVNPISDMLTRIRNAIKAGHKTVDIPLSNLKLEISRILKREDYINDYKKSSNGGKKTIEIDLKYPPTINSIKMVSRPGQRVYFKSPQLRSVKSGSGISIVSTPKGLMTNKDAKKANLGGEVLLEIW